MGGCQSQYSIDSMRADDDDDEGRKLLFGPLANACP